MTRTRRRARAATRATSSRSAARPVRATEVSNNHCGTANFSYRDARRTAGNTNDYNGKMLRLNPIEQLADGAKPAIGVGTTYSAADGDLAERPEPVRRHRGRRRQDQARDLRHGPAQPVAPGDRPQDGRPVRRVGRVRTPAARRPARARRPTRTPRSSRRAGNYGWPYCMGNQQAYRDRVADGSLRTTNGAGLRQRRPGRQPDGRLVRLQEPRQRLDQQHRPDHPAAHHGHGQGRRHGSLAERLVQPRQPGWGQRLPGLRRVRPAPTPRRTTARTPTAAVPVHHRLGRDGLHRPGLPLRRHDDRQLGPLAEVLGRPLVPAGLRQQLGQARACCSTRRRTRTARSRSTRTRSAAGSSGAPTTWTRSSVRTARSTSRSTRASSAPAPNVGMFKLSYTGGADTPTADPQWRSTSTARQVQFSAWAPRVA